jgi:hypothetical protein
VIQENSSGEIEQVKLPLLVYVSREKRPSHPHHFKAGALNALVRHMHVETRIIEYNQKYRYQYVLCLTLDTPSI